MITSGVFVSGTDTSIGKTVVSALLMAAGKKWGLSVCYFKPLQTGMDDDSGTVKELTCCSAEEILLPIYRFAEPAAPYWAAHLEQKAIDIERIRDSWNQCLRVDGDASQRIWILEGAGGLLVPIYADSHSYLTTRDLIKQLDLPLLIVSSTRLGTVNHTLLTIEAAQKSRIPICGIVLVEEHSLDESGKVNADDYRVAKMISQFSGVPILAQLPHFPEISSQTVNQAAPEYFPRAILSKIFLGVN